MANEWQALVDRIVELHDDPATKSAPGPSLQWYPQQYLADSMVLSMDWPARGVHVHLLNLAWKGVVNGASEEKYPCSLPAEEKLLWRILGRPREWKKIWPEVETAWKSYRGRLWNLGLVRSYLEQMETRRIRKKAAEARWGSTAPSESIAPELVVQYTDDANSIHEPCTGDANASDVQCSSSSSSSSSSAVPRKGSRQLSLSVVGDRERSHDGMGGNGSSPKAGVAAEIAWMVERVWEAHLRMRELHWRDVEIAERPPGAPPVLTQARRRLIADAIKRHDRDLLAAGDRAAWERDSRARAAGVGLFLSPWHNGTDPQNQVGQGGKRYLEPERAWKILNGIDPVDKFAEIYFERRERKERRKAS